MKEISYVDQITAQNIDKELMSEEGEGLNFSIDQLMELAGLGVALCILDYKPPPAKILIISGPGNNGGDGLVAARHLCSFGYEVALLYPKPGKNSLFARLLQQALAFGVTQVEDTNTGFSFKEPLRPPFDSIIASVASSHVPVVSVDVPSGWNVDGGPIDTMALQPTVLISLTVPKLSARFFKGIHYLTGRFLPPSLKEKYSLWLPAFSESQQFAKLFP